MSGFKIFILYLFLWQLSHSVYLIESSYTLSLFLYHLNIILGLLFIESVTVS